MNGNEELVMALVEFLKCDLEYAENYAKSVVERIKKEIQK